MIEQAPCLATITGCNGCNTAGYPMSDGRVLVRNETMSALRIERPFKIVF
jgi:hypothetical protein